MLRENQGSRKVHGGKRGSARHCHGSKRSGNVEVAGYGVKVVWEWIDADCPFRILQGGFRFLALEKHVWLCKCEASRNPFEVKLWFSALSFCTLGVLYRSSLKLPVRILSCQRGPQGTVITQIISRVLHIILQLVWNPCSQTMPNSHSSRGKDSDRNIIAVADRTHCSQGGYRVYGNSLHEDKASVSG